MSFRTLRVALLVAVAVCLLGPAAVANPKQAKLYLEAFPNMEKPKCIACHTIEKPKKDANHDLNAYGKKVKELTETPTADDYKKAGKIPA